MKIRKIILASLAMLLMMSISVSPIVNANAETYEINSNALDSNINSEIAPLSMNAYSEEVIEGKNILGYAVNATKHKFLDLKELRTGSHVLNTEFRAEKVANSVKTKTRGASINSYSENTQKMMYTKMMENMGLDNSVSLGCPIFTAEISQNYNINANVEYKSYVSQYFYKLSAQIDVYTYNLPLYSSGLAQYRANLDSAYQQQIIYLINNPTEENAEQFFNIFGTHIIAKGTFGGRMDLYYAALSNKVSVGASLKSSIDTAIKAQIDEKLPKVEIKGEDAINAPIEIDTNVNISFDVSNEIGVDSASILQQESIVTVGGKSTMSSINDINTGYKDWVNSLYYIDENGDLVDDTGLIEVSSDGLIPLWELIPTSYYNSTNKEIIKNLFKSYNQKHAVDFAKYQSGTIKKEIAVRSEQKKITDEGRFNNHIDEIDLSMVGDYSFELLRQSGYNAFNVTVIMDMKEGDDGYQYVFLFSSNKKSNDYLLATCQKELSDGVDKITNYQSNQEFEFDTIDLNFLTSPKLYIRYGASGNYNDDWYNKNVKVRIQFLRE